MIRQRLEPGKARFLMVDIQAKLLPLISNTDEVLKNSVRLLKLASVLDIQVDYTEQNPKGLGGTAPELLQEMPQRNSLFEKVHFCYGAEPGFDRLIGKAHGEVIVIWGTEAHICLLGTVMDLIERGHPVIVAADASGSRNKNSADLAFDAMRDWGALVLPTETIVYHLLARSGTDDFKKMLPLFK